MLKLSKLTDYSIVIMGLLVKYPDTLLSTQDIATKTAISRPTTSKLLKMLAKTRFVRSTRGTAGGYQLAIDPKITKLTQLLEALEGPLMLTECNLKGSPCKILQSCNMIQPWMKVNHMIYQTLHTLTLDDFFNTSIHRT